MRFVVVHKVIIVINEGEKTKQLAKLRNCRVLFGFFFVCKTFRCVFVACLGFAFLWQGKVISYTRHTFTHTEREKGEEK